LLTPKGLDRFVKLTSNANVLGLKMAAFVRTDTGWPFFIVLVGDTRGRTIPNGTFGHYSPLSYLPFDKYPAYLAVKIWKSRTRALS
jgi:hypothetical protein